MSLPPRLLKRSFIPAQPDPSKGQAPGPDGAPVGGPAGAPPPGGDPAAAGAPPGGAPMDPAAGPPMPAPGSAPADPASAAAMLGGGAPGGAGADPSAAAGQGDPDAQAAQDMMAAEGDSKPPTDPNASVTSGQAGVVMDIVERTLTAVGKNKKTAPPPAPGGPTGPGGAPAPGAPQDPSQMPGPITGMPGDMSAIAGNGPIKMGSDSTYKVEEYKPSTSVTVSPAKFVAGKKKKLPEAVKTAADLLDFGMEKTALTEAPFRINHGAGGSQMIATPGAAQGAGSAPAQPSAQQGAYVDPLETDAHKASRTPSADSEFAGMSDSQARQAMYGGGGGSSGGGEQAVARGGNTFTNDTEMPKNDDYDNFSGNQLAQSVAKVAPMMAGVEGRGGDPGWTATNVGPDGKATDNLYGKNDAGSYIQPPTPKNFGMAVAGSKGVQGGAAAGAAPSLAATTPQAAAEKSQAVAGTPPPAAGAAAPAAAMPAKPAAPAAAAAPAATPAPVAATPAAKPAAPAASAVPAPIAAGPKPAGGAPKTY